MRTLKLIVTVLFAALSLSVASPSHAIENVRGKPYHVTQKHGPWMIMVTSFRNVRDEDMRKDGLTAEQAAAELVFELREKGIPAYAFSQDAVKGQIDTRDRLGRDDRRIYAAQRDMICVLAGNYEAIDDAVGKKTLSFIKKFHPRFLKDTKSGAIVRADSAERGPLVGAFMTINPLIDPKDIVQKTADKEIKILNSGGRNPLIKNQHKYTVQVATFAGKSATPLGNSTYRGREGWFESKLGGETGFNLDRAGEEAERLAAYLRSKGSNGSTGLNEAYVHHDKFQSIVTVGGFDSPDDPRIRVVGEYYSPKWEPDLRAVSQARRATGAELTQEEKDQMPKVRTNHTEYLPGPTKESPPVQVWTFDSAPKVIPVPRVK
ncbi:MAG: hypothetical protein JWP89_6286 [Schlesneria sp.]|nr:hypothetical protein [Schlesneria sp.]